MAARCPPRAGSAHQHGADPGAAARRAAQGAARRVEQVQPGAGELAAQLGRHLSTPGVIVAAICAATALVACLVVGFVTAIATPDDSVIGAVSAGEGVLTETLRLAVGTTMARVDLEGGPDSFGPAAGFVSDRLPVAILPVLVLLVPLGAVALAAYLQAARTAGMGRWSRLLWPAASGIPLAWSCSSSRWSPAARSSARRATSPSARSSSTPCCGERSAGWVGACSRCAARRPRPSTASRRYPPVAGCPP